MSIENQIVDIAKSARAAARQMAVCDTDQKNSTLLAIAGHIENNAAARADLAMSTIWFSMDM